MRKKLITTSIFVKISVQLRHRKPKCGRLWQAVQTEKDIIERRQ